MSSPGGHGGVASGAATGASAELLRRLHLTVTRRLDGMLQGDYQGLLPGPGSEPGEARRYEVGDDVRRIDWSVTARTRELHVRTPIADRELETWVVVDLSPSLDFGTATCEKRDLAVAATAAVGHLTARAGNRIGALVLTGTGVRRVPARPGRRHLDGLLHHLISAPRGDGGGRTRLAPALEELHRIARHRGMAVVVSDFLGEPGWERPMRALAARHDLLAVEVLDPRELELPDVGLLAVVDPETGERLEVPTGSAKLRDRYVRAAADERERNRAALASAGADHLLLRTDRDWLLDVVAFVERRRRRHRPPGVARR